MVRGSVGARSGNDKGGNNDSEEGVLPMVAMRGNERDKDEDRWR